MNLAVFKAWSTKTGVIEKRLMDYPDIEDFIGSSGVQNEFPDGIAEVFREPIREVGCRQPQIKEIVVEMFKRGTESSWP